jgi:hypothetical protein
MNDIERIHAAMHVALRRRADGADLDRVAALFVQEIEDVFTVPEFDANNLMESFNCRSA